MPGAVLGGGELPRKSLPGPSPDTGVFSLEKRTWRRHQIETDRTSCPPTRSGSDAMAASWQ